MNAKNKKGVLFLPAFTARRARGNRRQKRDAFVRCGGTGASFDPRCLETATGLLPTNMHAACQSCPWAQVQAMAATLVKSKMIAVSAILLGADALLIAAQQARGERAAGQAAPSSVAGLVQGAAPGLVPAARLAAHRVCAVHQCRPSAGVRLTRVFIQAACWPWAAARCPRGALLRTRRRGVVKRRNLRRAAQPGNGPRPCRRFERRSGGLGRPALSAWPAPPRTAASRVARLFAAPQCGRPTRGGST